MIMKRMQITCLSMLMAFAISCKDTPKKPEGQQDRETLPEAVIDNVAADTVDTAHNSANSLDWAGTYSGVALVPIVRA